MRRQKYRGFVTNKRVKYDWRTGNYRPSVNVPVVDGEEQWDDEYRVEKGLPFCMRCRQHCVDGCGIRVSRTGKAEKKLKGARKKASLKQDPFLVNH